MCDGERVSTLLPGGGVETVPAWRGLSGEPPVYSVQVPCPLYPVFPIAAPIWGRSGDEWRMLSALRDGTDLRVTLEHAERGDTGTVVIATGDQRTGHHVRLLSLAGIDIRVMELDTWSPPDLAAFTVE
ncbi:hypothetical protein SMC26_29040 [Actinomadura fulvescens]|uniref:Uncharacterized protein n=1 Tax=Actinomadura fulvescens TaxID=46160 RepID=A0ABP6CC65_9ACTN